MSRSQRRLHLVAWLLLVPLALTVIAIAVGARRNAPSAGPSAASRSAR